MGVDCVWGVFGSRLWSLVIMDAASTKAKHTFEGTLHVLLADLHFLPMSGFFGCALAHHYPIPSKPMEMSEDSEPGKPTWKRHDCGQTLTEEIEWQDVRRDQVDERSAVPAAQPLALLMPPIAVCAVKAPFKFIVQTRVILQVIFAIINYKS
ncbi:hypothetical protein B0H10DRAFT_1969499 [Mycena sp. CBHHK59/15]|nr:hypothetical protein B0H10DRAFT_1969499 [Mycena sp. CBHHK59/15]